VTIKVGVDVLNDEMKKTWLSMITIRRLFAAVMILCSLVFLELARADSVWLQGAKLTATDGAAADHFGASVSISGDYAIVGAACDNDRGADSGSAYIFWWDGTDWIQQAKLTAADGDAGHWFGNSVSISGDYVIVGARYGDGNFTNTGVAYIFWRNGTGWVQQAKLIATDGVTGDCFAISVSISGDYAIVGAFCDDNRGSAYIFERDGNGWSQKQKLIAADGDDGDGFGKSVSIDGDKVIVGAYGDDDKGNDSGSAYIFRLLYGTHWVRQQKITAADSALGDSFGRSVSINGDRVIVGAYWDDDRGIDSGSVYMFRWGGTSWVQQQKLTAADGDTYDWFGFSVSISGDYAVIGVNGKDDLGVDAGLAYVFKWDGTGWVQQQKLTALDGVAKDWFGRSVFINGDRTIVGAPLDDDNGNNSGSAYIFAPSDGPAH